MDFPETNFDGSRLSHAYISAGEMAQTIATAAVCADRSANGPCRRCAHCIKASREIHPDITVISCKRDKKEITVDQIRELKKDVIIIPNEADKKAYIINDAHLMNTNAQNAFLQILEEPPAHAVFILKTDAPSQLLPTIRSRCLVIRSYRSISSTPASEATPEGAEGSEMANKFFSALESGNIGIIKFMFSLEKLDKKQFDNFLTSARNEAASRLRNQAAQANEPITMSSKKIALAESLLSKAGRFVEMNVNIGHISGYICASLME